MAIRDTLLLACGTAASRGILRSIFEDTFNILETLYFLLYNKYNKKYPSNIPIIPDIIIEFLAILTNKLKQPPKNKALDKKKLNIIYCLLFII